MKARVLLVDDQQLVLEGLSRHLDKRLFDVRTANDVEAAIEILSAEPMDALVSDEQMPGPPGTQLLSLSRQRWPDTVRIMLTGKANVASAIRAVTEGRVFRYLEKPCPAQELMRVLRDGLLRRRALRLRCQPDLGMSQVLPRPTQRRR